MNLLSSRKFVFNPVLIVVMAVSLVILIGLGVWQLHRLQWKHELVAKIEARVEAEPSPFFDINAKAATGQDVSYTPVVVTGTFQHQYEAHVFGTLDGDPGYYIFTPLTVENEATQWVYINRGFVPQNLKDRSSRKASMLKGPQVIEGLFRRPQKPQGIAASFTPKSQADINQWHVRLPQEFAAVAGRTTVSSYIDAGQNSAAVEWPKGGTTRVEFNNRHFEYALTWFGLALTLIGVWVAFSWQKPDA